MNYQQQIDEIMDNFDFHKVHLAMLALQWSWITIGIPNESDLRKKARQQLIELSTSSYLSIGSGGFTATKDSDGYLSLSFQVDSWDTNPEV